MKKKILFTLALTILSVSVIVAGGQSSIVSLPFQSVADASRSAARTVSLPAKADVLEILNTVNQTWQNRHPSHGDYFWNRAVYHIGNMAAYDVTHDNQYQDYSTAWAEKSHWWGATGTDKSRWQYATYGEGSNWVLFGDNQVCFQVYIDLYHLDPTLNPQKIERALEVMGYEISTENVDYIWWVDGLFMVMPILSKLYIITGNQAYLDKMYAYWKYTNSIMYDEDTGLYFRDARYVYPGHQTYSGKKDFWARGDGWVFAALAKVLQDLPATDAHRNEYITYYRRLAAALKDCQQAEGYWTRSLLDAAQAPGYETSGTALNTFAFAWGLRNGILEEEEFGPTLERAWSYLSTIALQSNGTVGYIQPIGENASPNTTVSASDYHDFGVGAYLMAAAEVSRLATGEVELPRLRLIDAKMMDSRQLMVRFNLPPYADDAIDASHYLIDGSPISAYSIEVQNNGSVVIQLDAPLDYGRYTLSVEGIHTADGGEMQEGQQHLLLLTVPLDGEQPDIDLSAIGSQWGNPFTHVNDNNLATRWSQEGYEQWICFDLRENKIVYAVDVAFYNGDQRQFFFKVQTSLDNLTWNDVTDDLNSSGQTNEMERYRFESVEARYVRLLCSGNTTNRWNSPTEIRIRYTDPDGFGRLPFLSPLSPASSFIDLSGRRIGEASSRAGIYIINGLKVLVK
ncbi:MAG: glycoside hydrolase family 88 protein [Bacteroidales bacterium]|nr:glycoside hydrolase family 88 protein [Bacteroidales bacterium]